MKAKKTTATGMNAAQVRAMRAHALELAQRIRSDNRATAHGLAAMQGIRDAGGYTAEGVISDAEKLITFIMR
jgi:hypothetical protein